MERTTELTGRLIGCLRHREGREKKQEWGEDKHSFKTKEYENEIEKN